MKLLTALSRPANWVVYAVSITILVVVAAAVTTVVGVYMMVVAAAATVAAPFTAVTRQRQLKLAA